LQDSLNSFLTTPYGFAIFFVALWCVISYIISLTGDWFALSRRFTRQSEPYGETRSAGPFFYGVYTRFWTHYGSVIRMIAAEDALYLSVLILFRVGHPPLSIPWKEIQISRTRWFFRRYVVLTLGQQEQIPFRISERMARKLGILGRIPGSSDPPPEPNFDKLNERFSAPGEKRPG